VIDLDLVVLASGLAALVPALWSLVIRRRRWHEDARAFAGGSLPVPHAATRLAVILRGLAALSFVLAAASPRLTGTPQATPAERTLVVVLDVSMSMLAADVAPSRLDEARRQLREAFSTALPGRIALVAFAAEPTLVCPPTTDRSAFDDLLAATREDAALPGPSRASLALLRALALLAQGNGDVVLVSDGEFPDEDREQLPDILRAARRQGARVWTVGVGTAGGATVPLRDGAPGQAAVDESGRPAASRLDRAMLSWIADEGEGAYVELAPGARLELAGAIERLRLAGDVTPPHLRPFGPVSLFGYPLAIGLLLLLADAWLAWRPRRASVAAPVIACVLLAMTPSVARAQAGVAAVRRGNDALAAGRVDDAIASYRAAIEIDASSAIARVNLGTALYRAGRFDVAAETLAASVEGLTDTGHRATAHYNLGNALAQLGRLDDALAAYRASLRIRDDAAARFNYALVWRWKQAQGESGPSLAPPMDEQRVQELRDKARALDVPIVRRPSDQKPPVGTDR
jgi:Ca-activated chloride channel family protein